MIENEFVGRRFGTYVVGASIENTKPKLWYCQCDCGNIIKCSKHSITRELKSRRCSKCDPVRVPIAPKDAVAGSIFKTNCGTDLIVIKYNKSSDIEVQFSDLKTPPFQADIGNLRKGKYKNPFCVSVGKSGYLGQGIFSKSTDKSLYVRWSSMIVRADDSGDRRSCQKDISVCEEWLCFQRFRDWYYSQLGNDQGWEVDKDLLVFKNTHYSPETCTLLPRGINGKIPKRTSFGAYQYKTGLWKGVYRDIYGNRKTVSGKDKFLVAATSISNSFLTIKEIVETNNFHLEDRAILRINNMTNQDFVLSEILAKEV